MPLNRLPPVFGIMLKEGPPRSTSPNPPEMVIWISEASLVGYPNPATPPPLKAEPTFMPSIWIVPSLPRPPRDVKKFVDTLELTSNPVPEIPGTVASRLP